MFTLSQTLELRRLRDSPTIFAFWGITGAFDPVDRAALSLCLGHVEMTTKFVFLEIADRSPYLESVISACSCIESESDDRFQKAR